MLKLSFWRRSYPPRRDWPHTRGFSLRTANYTAHYDPTVTFDYGSRNAVHAAPSLGQLPTPATGGQPGSLHFLERWVASKFFWLCGEPAPTFLGGPCWPNHYGDPDCGAVRAQPLAQRTLLAWLRSPLGCCPQPGSPEVEHALV